MLDFRIDYWFVDTIPFGAHVARRDDEDGHIAVYLSRGATEVELTAGLTAIHNAASLEYECQLRHAVAS